MHKLGSLTPPRRIACSTACSSVESFGTERSQRYSLFSMIATSQNSSVYGCQLCRLQLSKITSGNVTDLKLTLGCRPTYQRSAGIGFHVALGLLQFALSVLSLLSGPSTL